jgi:succinate---hydroxymethylglutarate CoA-transferase
MPPRPLSQRSWGPPFLGEGAGRQSTYFLGVNKSKRSIAVDYTHPEGRRVAQSLAAKADVIVESFRPGTLDRHGLGYDEVCKTNPGVVYCSVTGYGHSGPAREQSGYDVAISAEGGLMSITGEADGPPVKTGVAVIDLSTGLHAAMAILAALVERQTRQLAGEATPPGRFLDVSLFDCQLGMLANVASASINAPPGSPPPKRWGSAHSSIVPYQAFQCGDGQPLVVTAMNDPQFAKLCRVLGGPLAGMEHTYATNAGRVQHRDVVIPAIQKALEEHAVQDRDEMIKLLHSVDLAASPINTVPQAFQTPQAQARGAVTHLEHPVTGKVNVVSPVVKASVPCSQAIADPSAVRARSPPPLLGEHTRAVLSDWQVLSSEEIDLGCSQGWLRG